MTGSGAEIDRFKGRLHFNVPMSSHTSIGVGGAADVLAAPADLEDVRIILRFAGDKGYPLLAMGSGTNLLVKDGGVRGVVLDLSEGFGEITVMEENRLEAGAGVRLHELVALCKERGLSGLEFAAGIPGCVGGAVAMNAGAYGGEMKDIVEDIEICNRKGKVATIGASDIGFTYRGSGLAPDVIILKARMKLVQSSAEEVKKRIGDYRGKRRGTQAINLPNAGSVFKNPEKVSAGRLIEEAGLKGISRGGAQVSEVHANYIVNRGNAKASDVLALIAEVRDSVFQRTGILLEPEIKVVGEEL
ncbi:MAG: UDP-N-acetylmuramate dehydrogenase [Thermodesulfobacteriota bacterium]